jgi:hypothetical protein
MQQIMNGYRGLSLLVNINWDRIIYLGTILMALFLGGFIGSF